MIPLCLIVSGPPCTGKTTLAGLLAEELGLPLMTKDTIKERLFEVLGTRDRAWSKRLGGASMELLYLFAEAILASGRSCVVEGNYSAHYATSAFRAIASRVRYLPIQVNCVAEPEVLRARFRARVQSGERHPGHQDHLPRDPAMDVPIPGRLEPLNLEGHVIELDTTDFSQVDHHELCARVQDLWHQETAHR